MTPNHFRYPPHHELMSGRDSEAIRRNRRIDEVLGVNRYEKLKVSNPISVIVGRDRTVVIAFRSVLGVMAVEMGVDDAVAVGGRAMVVDVCVNERGGERSPQERH